jgi:peptidylprolyl isomerase
VSLAVPGCGASDPNTRTTDTGLQITEVQDGTGDAAEVGDHVFVHYTGTLPDGVQFDSSRGGGKPLDFDLGAKGMIAGFSEGILGLKVGGQRKLVVPPHLAYGRGGRPPLIPANTPLTFDVELVKLLKKR